MGRQSTYRAEIADRILERLADGLSLNSICAAEDMPSESTVRGWAIDITEFAAKYARARKIGLDVQAEGMTAISDDKTLDPAVRRDMLDIRKWLFARMGPAKWGDRVQVAGDPNAPLIPHVIVEFVKTKKDGE